MLGCICDYSVTSIGMNVTSFILLSSSLFVCLFAYLSRLSLRRAFRVFLRILLLFRLWILSAILSVYFHSNILAMLSKIIAIFILLLSILPISFFMFKLQSSITLYTIYKLNLNLLSILHLSSYFFVGRTLFQTSSSLF